MSPSPKRLLVAAGLFFVLFLALSFFIGNPLHVLKTYSFVATWLSFCISILSAAAAIHVKRKKAYDIAELSGNQLARFFERYLRDGKAREDQTVQVFSLLELIFYVGVALFGILEFLYSLSFFVGGNRLKRGIDAVWGIDYPRDFPPITFAFVVLSVYLVAALSARNGVKLKRSQKKCDITHKLSTSFSFSKSDSEFFDVLNDGLKGLLRAAIQSTEFGLWKKTCRCTFEFFNKTKLGPRTAWLYVLDYKKEFFEVKLIVPSDPDCSEYDKVPKNFKVRAFLEDKWVNDCKAFGETRGGPITDLFQKRLEYGSDVGILAKHRFGQGVDDLEKECLMHDDAYFSFIPPGSRWSHTLRSGIIMPMYDPETDEILGVLGFYSPAYDGFDKVDYWELKWYRDVIAVLLRGIWTKKGKR